MLSILIPTHNYPCITLISQLQAQASLIQESYEIIVMDDASDIEFVEKNRPIGKMENCRFIRQETNIGRAKIRNLLASEAKGDWLMFMDCDGLIFSEHFLSAYLSAREKAPVICGGLCHPNTLPNPNVTLRYIYEKRADLHRSAKERRQHPYECFSTFCFAIRHDTFFSIKFNENCRNYGYEDTLFGEELKQRSIPIYHFDNPLIHMGLEDNATFLKKTETALHTLISLQQHNTHFHSKLVNKYKQLHKYGFHLVLSSLFCLTAPLLRKNLLSQHPSLFLFAFYKLGYYAHISSEYKKI